MATYNGGQGRDRYVGGSENDLIYGNGGNDRLRGGDGSDIVAGGAGEDFLDGGAGDDILFSNERYVDFGYPWSIYDLDAPMDRGTKIDRMTGGDGDDYIFAGTGDFVDGGTQEYTGNRLYISFQGATAGVDADFRLLQSEGSITIAGGTITNIQSVGYLEGSEFDDTLVAIDTPYSSDAPIFGRGGNDHLIANYFSGSAGTGGLWGGTGDDLLEAGFAAYGVSLYGEAGNDTIRATLGDADGGAGDDIITGDGFSIHGDAGADTITLYSANTVFGDAGDDTISVGYEDVTISGGSGDDTVAGGWGSDVLIGDRGRDTLTGGDRADIFQFALGDSARIEGKADTITDFHQAELDRIRLVGEGDPFSFVGKAAFTGIAGQVGYDVVGHDTIVRWDADGDRKADLSIRVTGRVALTTQDFDFLSGDAPVAVWLGGDRHASVAVMPTALHVDTHALVLA